MNGDFPDTMSIPFKRPAEPTLPSNTPGPSEPSDPTLLSSMPKQPKLSTEVKFSDLIHLGLMYEDGGIKAYLNALRSRQRKETNL
jgi:hypothetical protein